MYGLESVTGRVKLIARCHTVPAGLAEVEVWGRGRKAGLTLVPG